MMIDAAARARARAASRSPSRTSARSAGSRSRRPSRSRSPRRRDADADRVDVDVPGYARATVRFADRVSRRRRAPRARAARRIRAPRRITAARDVRRSLDVPRPGVPGRHRASARSATTASTARSTMLPAPGALLDCAGQLMGWWVMHTRDARPPRDAGARSSASRCSRRTRRRASASPCSVRMRDVGEREVRADLELARDGACGRGSPAGKIAGSTATTRCGRVLMYPERNALADPQRRRRRHRDASTGAAPRRAS